jgi:hypothetical protein
MKEEAELLDSLTQRLQEETSRERKGAVLQVAEQMREKLRWAVSELQRYRAIPRDADTTCRCGRNDHHRLPAGLADQLLDVHITD